MTFPPKSTHETVGGMTCFPRMLDKIRLNQSKTLRPDFCANLGAAQGLDGACCSFLRVSYSELKKRTLEGGDDEAILAWCYETGRKLDESDLRIWNEFARKLGWNDHASPILERLKAESGLVNRYEIQTMAEYFEVDEGRKT